MTKELPPPNLLQEIQDIQDQLDELQDQLKSQQTLIEENNQLLHSLNRGAWISFWLRIAWYALLLGLPFFLYFYFLEPYFTAVTNSIDQLGLTPLNPLNWWEVTLPTGSEIEGFE